MYIIIIHDNDYNEANLFFIWFYHASFLSNIVIYFLLSYENHFHFAINEVRLGFEQSSNGENIAIIIYIFEL